MRNMKFILGSDSYLLNLGLEKLLKEEKGMDVIWTTNEKTQLISGIRKYTPDFVILTTDFIDQPMLDELELIFNEDPPFKILVLKTKSRIPKEFYKITSGILSTSDSKGDFITKLNALAVMKKSEFQSKNNTSTLTPREQNILREVTLGQTNKEIGEKLFISTHTVITHRKNITHKLGIKTVSGLTVYAILNKITTLEEISERGKF